MYSWIRKMFPVKQAEPDKKEPDKPYEYFKTHLTLSAAERARRREQAFQVTQADFHIVDGAMDEFSNPDTAKRLFTVGQQVLPEKLLDWYVF